MIPLAEDRPDEAGQAGAGADLHEGRDPVGREGLDLGDELHRPGDLFGEEGPGRLRVVRVWGRGGVGVDRHPSPAEGERAEGGTERFGGIGHEGAVEGRGHGEALAGELPGGEEGHGPFDLAARAGEDRLGGGVPVGDDQVEPLLGEGLHDEGERCGHRQHPPPVAVPRRHETAPEAREVMEGPLVEPPGGAEGGQFAVAVAGRRVRREAEGLQEPERAEAHRADGGLGHVGGAELLFLPLPFAGRERRGGIDPVGEADAVRSGEIPVGRGKGLEELGEGAGEIPEHPGVLGTLAGEEDGELSRPAAGGVEGAVRGLPRPFRVCPEQLQGVGCKSGDIGPVPLHHEGEAAGVGGVECRAGRGSPVTHSAPGEVGRERRQGALHLCRRGGGEGDHLDRPVPVGTFPGRPVLFEERVEVGTAEAEGADGGAARPLPGGEPRPFLGGQVEGGPASRHLREGGGDLDGGGDDPVVEGEGRLDEPRRAGRRLGVADLGLDRAEGAPGAVRLAVHLAERRDLHRVPHPRPGAVGLHEADALRRHPGPLVGVVKRLCLAGGAGGVDGVAPAVAGGADPPDDRVDPVVVPLRVREPLEDHDPEPLAEDRPVGGGIERSGVPGGGEGRGLAEAHVHEDVVEGVDPAGHHEIGLPRGQLHPGQVEGAEGAGAGSVHDAVGPPQVVLLADPPGDHVAEEAGEGVLLPGDVGVGNPRHHVVGHVVGHAGLFQSLPPAGVAEAGAEGDHELQGAGDPEDDAGPAPVVVALRAVARIPQGLAGGHEPQELGGVDRLQGGRGDVVLQGVERDRREEAAALPVGHVRGLLIGSEVVVGVPVGGGDAGDGVDPLPDIAPECRGVVGPRKEAADADDGERRGRCRRDAVRSRVLSGHPRYSLSCSRGRGAARRSSGGRSTPWFLRRRARFRKAAP